MRKGRRSEIVRRGQGQLLGNQMVTYDAGGESGPALAVYGRLKKENHMVAILDLPRIPR